MVHCMFDKVETMEVGVADQYRNWFCHFLMNFEVKWPWAKWKHIAELSTEHPQRLFLNAVIEGCVRYSYVGKIADAIPEELRVLLPPNPNAGSKYIAEGSITEGVDGAAATFEIADGIEGAEVFKILVSKINEETRDVHGPKIVKDYIDKELRADDNGALRVEVFMEAILFAGAKSYGAFLDLCMRYSKDILLQMKESDEHQSKMIECVNDVWQSSPQVLYASSLFGGLLVTSR
jgi:hypothetical protein